MNTDTTKEIVATGKARCGVWLRQAHLNDQEPQRVLCIIKEVTDQRATIIVWRSGEMATRYADPHRVTTNIREGERREIARLCAKHRMEVPD